MSRSFRRLTLFFVSLLASVRLIGCGNSPSEGGKSDADETGGMGGQGRGPDGSGGDEAPSGGATSASGGADSGSGGRSSNTGGAVGGEGGVSSLGGEGGALPPACEDECEAGLLRCESGATSRCVAASSGCTVWGPESECASGLCAAVDCAPLSACPEKIHASWAEILTADDVAALQGVTRIEGNFYINASEVTDLVGLECLKEVTGDIEIRDNQYLQSLSGLDRLETIGDELWIDNNTQLTSLSGMKSLRATRRGLYLYENPILEDVALPALRTVGDKFWIVRNPKMRDLTGLGNMERFPMNLSITGSDELETLDGLNGAPGVTGSLFIQQNPRLRDISGLTGFPTYLNELTINYCPLVTDLSPFSTLTRLYNLELRSMSGLVDLSGLSNLDVSMSTLYLSYNENLVRLTGLEGVQSISQTTYIGHNASLESLSVFDDVDYLSGITIEYNDVLPQCEVERLMIDVFEWTQIPNTWGPNDLDGMCPVD